MNGKYGILINDDRGALHQEYPLLFDPPRLEQGKGWVPKQAFSVKSPAGNLDKILVVVAVSAESYPTSHRDFLGFVR
jgi:hypothetical protein